MNFSLLLSSSCSSDMSHFYLCILFFFPLVLGIKYRDPGTHIGQPALHQAVCPGLPLFLFLFGHRVLLRCHAGSELLLHPTLWTFCPPAMVSCRAKSTVPGGLFLLAMRISLGLTIILFLWFSGQDCGSCLPNSLPGTQWPALHLLCTMGKDVRVLLMSVWTGQELLGMRLARAGRLSEVVASTLCVLGKSLWRV